MLPPSGSPQPPLSVSTRAAGTLTLTPTLTLILTLTSYRSMDRSLTDEEINALQNTMRERAADELAVELR